MSSVPENAPEHCPGTDSSNAGQASACAGCPNQQICASGAAAAPDPGLIKRFLKDVEWEGLDYLVIDTPPGTSDEHLTLAHYLLQGNAAAAVVVTTPQEVSLLDVRKEITFCERVKLPMAGIVENMTMFVCPKCKGESVVFPSATGGAASLAAESGVPLIARLPLDPLVARACDEGTNFLLDHPDSPAARAYLDLAQSQF
ncbi:hypothetical protein HAZT_HAZT002013 [Hyalella azteca]|uniref:Uncharacterized protein n=1 Tax=Hyalella azteca TaxID=294128 RepID=A0A6A0H9S4_HYAAZ|nr:hypothetical protein HAZT_HAZT002013 [Hyalella azteca]